MSALSIEYFPAIDVSSIKYAMGPEVALSALNVFPILSALLVP